MPHLRKPSRVVSQSNDGRVKENDVGATLDKTVSKVDQATKCGIIKFEGPTEEGTGNETTGTAEEGKSDIKPVCDKKSGGCGKVTEGAIKKAEGKSRPNRVGTGKRNSENTTIIVTSVENYPVKEKKVKFAEGKHSERKTGQGYPGGKQEKHKFYPYKGDERKGILPLAQPPELFVPQLGEIAVLTDLVPEDPISACLPCLEANGTYICTPCNPRCFIIQKMSVASEPTPGSGCRLRGGSASSNNSATTPPNQLKGGVAGPLHQRPRPCRLCWYCCCSCSCLAVKTDEEHKDSNKGSNNENSDQNEKPPLEEIRSWGTSFDKLMKSPAGRNVFRDFLRCEYSEENILFWLACEELKNASNPEEVEEKARVIYEEYISILSPKEVSLDARVREQVNRNMVAPTPHIFDEAQLQIYTLMHRDSYPRFVNSAMYKEQAQLTNGNDSSGTGTGPGTGTATSTGTGSGSGTAAIRKDSSA